MRAIILSAGRGERMRPLTDHTPKPLLKIKNKALIEYHLEKLSKIKVKDVVVNCAWLGEKIEKYLGDGSNFNLNIHYSREPEGGLDTAGGIINALNLLKNKPFLVINGDIFTDIDFSKIKLPQDKLAHLILIKNPKHNQQGDFSLDCNKNLQFKNSNSFTYSGVGIYNPDLFKNQKVKRLKLRYFIDDLIKKNKITAEIHQGFWSDIGTVERLNYCDNLDLV